MEAYFDKLDNIGKLEFYINNMCPVLNKEALFADGTDDYRQYIQDKHGLNVKLRFRTAKDNVQKVILVTDKISLPMTKADSDKLFDFYEIQVKYPDCGSNYYFEAVSGKIHTYYNKKGPLSAPVPFYNFVFRPQMHAPDWAKGAVFYQLYVDRFNNGDKSNDIIDGEYSYLKQRAWSEMDWNAYPKIFDVCHFYGGDIQGILDKLDYLQELGIEVIYLNPVFVSPSNHKYDTQDYDYIDPHFGKIVTDGGSPLSWSDEDNSHASIYIKRVTSKENLEASNEFFADFVKEVHRRGMRVILDGVFNHCGSFNKWMDREGIYEGQPGYAPGAYVSSNSPYNSYFKFNTKTWPYNTDYEGWWGHTTLPKLNYEESESLYQYVLHIGRKWVSPPYNCDGWRLDVAADLGYSREFNHKFWSDFRRAVKDANPEAIILAENYSDPSEWLQGDQWDTVMNYEAFMEPVTWFLTGMEKHSDNRRKDLKNNYQVFESTMLHHMSRFHHDSLYTAMNELSNHDHSRFLTRTNEMVGRLATRGPEAAKEGVRPAVMREAVIIQMTWPGAPTVYYGDEAGQCGWTDPDNRRTYPWGNEDKEMLLFHKEMIRLHKSSSALRTGSLKMICGGNGYMAYGRFDKNERYLVIINNLEKANKISVPVWQIGVDSANRMEQQILSSKKAFSLENRTYPVKDGFLSIELPALSGIVLKEVSK